jgi:hypothetical protein
MQSDLQWCLDYVSVVKRQQNACIQQQFHSVYGAIKRREQQESTDVETELFPFFIDKGIVRMITNFLGIRKRKLFTAGALNMVTRTLHPIVNTNTDDKQVARLKQDFLASGEYRVIDRLDDRNHRCDRDDRRDRYRDDYHRVDRRDRYDSRDRRDRYDSRRRSRSRSRSRSRARARR